MASTGRQMMLWSIVIWIMTTEYHKAEGLVAYDCADKDVNISTISLRNVAECPEPQSTYQAQRIDVRVLQRSDVGLQHVL